MTAPSSDRPRAAARPTAASGAGARTGAGRATHDPAPDRPAASRGHRRLYRVLWIALAVFSLASILLTQSINRFAPGNADEARAMGAQLEQRFGKGNLVRLEATMRDRVKAVWSDELPATATIYVSGERADPASQVIYSCRFVRDDGDWRLDDLELVVDPQTGAQ